MKRTERRLAAILAADMVGYSKLMENDESGTIARQKTHRRELIDPCIADHRGRIVKTTGDGLLVEFASVVDATECAVVVQRAISEREADVPEDRRIRYRVGINLGDIVIDGDDILGDGVNIAARLEQLAEPNGVCVSAFVKEQVAGKISAGFEDLGEQQVKNISRPIHVYQLVLEERMQPAKDSVSDISPGDEGKASVAILPLINMSGDTEQEYFADGLTEDLITELSRFPNLSVIARNSVFTYKGRTAKIQDVAKDLGVQFVVEGSVRKASDRVRVTVQLIDAAFGSHLWAERYDRSLNDIFDLQDELTQAIAATISGRLEYAVAERLKSKPPTNLNAYDCVMRAKLCHHRGSAEDNIEALRLLDSAIEKDPGFASAYAWKICVLSQAWSRGYREYTDEDKATSVELISKGILEDPNDLECMRILCELYMEKGQFEDAQRCHEKAFRLNPNDPRIVAQRGELLTWRGHAVEAVEWLKRAERLDPFNSEEWAHLLGRALFGARRYKESLSAFKNAPRPVFGNFAYMVACLSHLESTGEIDLLKSELLRLKEDFSAKKFVQDQFYENDGDREHLLECLITSGLAP